MYIQRTIKTAILHASAFFPVVLITGPRQVGKTTVLKNTDMENRLYVSLDILENRELAQKDPALFLQRFPAPVLIDEIQYAPELFPYIKDIVDTKNTSGMFWITGSQQFNLMQNVSESLAGRVGILRLQGLSQQEKHHIVTTMPFLPSTDFLQHQTPHIKQSNITQTFHSIWQGAYPKLYTADDTYWDIFFESYVQTYIEKDIKNLTHVSNEMDFLKFMQALAARTAQLLNYADLAKDIGVSQPTIKSWVSILQISGIIYLLYPYSNNMTTRVIKTPKIYFMDTGLAAYLTGWKTPQVLETGAMNGAFLETFVISEIIKGYWHNGKQPNISFYRDKDKKEIDIILEQNNALYPTEIKKRSNPTTDDIKHFRVLNKFGKDIKSGAVLCFANTHRPITKTVTAIPIDYL